MKLRHSPIALLVVVIGGLPPGPIEWSPAARAQGPGTVLLSRHTEVQWRTDYQTARKEAHDKNLPILIDFGTVGCFWCRRMDETTFRDPRVVALVNERFVPLKIDAERDVHLANILHIESYPTLVAAAPDGTIVDLHFRSRPMRPDERPYLKGYQEAETLHETLQRLSTSMSAPEWMQRELELAAAKEAQGDHAAAIAALRGILNDSKGRAIHAQARKRLDAIERKAMDRIGQARELQERGKIDDAVAHLGETVRAFAGLEASRQAGDLLARLKEQTSSENNLALRTQKARDLLAQAREFYKQRDLVPCLERCAALMRDYVDLPEGQDGMILMSELKSNPVLLQQAADSLSERLGEVYLALADSHMQKGQPQRAEFYLQRVVLACPGTRYAESAQVRLAQLQGIGGRTGSGITSAGNPE